MVFFIPRPHARADAILTPLYRAVALALVLLAAGLLLGAAVLAPGRAHAAEPAIDTAGWNRAESANFTVYTNVGGDAARRAALNLEALRHYLVEIAPAGRFEADVPFHMYLFTDPVSLAPFLAGGDASSSGVLVPTDDAVYGATVWAERGGASRFISKQYIAWVLSERLPELPHWFHRGLTDFYSTFEIASGEAHLGKPVPRHLAALRRAALSRRNAEADRLAKQAARKTESDTESPPVDGTAEDEAEEAELERRSIMVFSESRPNELVETGSEIVAVVNPADWALVHYLLLGSDDMRPRVRPYLSAVTAGADPETAFRESFGVEREDLAQALEDYVLQDHHRFVRIPLTGEGVLQVSVEAMSTAEVHHRLGVLHLHSGGSGDATALAAADERFQSALAADRGHALARAGLAELAARRGDLTAAIAGYQAAVQGRPEDGRLLYRLGDARLKSLGGRRPQADGPKRALEAAVTDLRRATELVPDFPSAWERLGYALTLTPQPTHEAVTALERAAELRPGRIDVIYNLLLARARVADRLGVGEAMARLRQLGADPATLARGREIELRLMLHQGNALVRSERLDDAVALFAQVMTETKDEALADAASHQLEFIATVTQRNLYASLYQRASGLIDAGEPEAAKTVQELLAMARPGLQREAAEVLAERLDNP